MPATKRPGEDRKDRSLIGAIIAALDDRNVSAALALLDPAGDGDTAAADPAGREGPRCARCVTRGE
ncbi:MAG TPA: hypothetical protein VIY51_14135 [Xanthobacteraceae bacterium]